MKYFITSLFETVGARCAMPLPRFHVLPRCHVSLWVTPHDDFLKALFIGIFIFTATLFSGASLWSDTAGAASPAPPDIGTAWEAYNQGDYIQADHLFSTLSNEEKSHQKQWEAMLGLAYTRLKREMKPSAAFLFITLAENRYRLDQTLSMAMSLLSEIGDIKTMDKLLTELKPEEIPVDLGEQIPRWMKSGLSTALAAINIEKESETCLSLTDRILALDPEDQSALNQSGWCYYHQKDFPRAETRFRALYRLDRDNPDSVVGLGYSLYQQGKIEAVRALIEEKNTATPAINELKKRVADHYFAKGNPVLASQLLQTVNTPGTCCTHDSSSTCYTNASALRGDIAWFFGKKGGDTGTSKLERHTLSVKGVYPYGMGYQLSITGIADRLSSGGTPPDTVGNAFRLLNGREPETLSDGEEEVYQFQMGWKKEGEIHIDASIGTSALNAPSSATPIGHITLEKKDWRFDLHRNGIRESLLSWTGMEDPYGQGTWGRVIQSGVKLGKSLGWEDGRWFAFSLALDRYRGENVWKNRSWAMDTAMGRTRPLGKDYEMTVGVFATLKSFDHNTNHFTWGHGGYYSPQLMGVMGPLFRLQSTQCRTYRVDLQLSAGWMVEKTDDVPKYPIHYEVIRDFSSEAINALQDNYLGENDARLVYTASIEGWKFLTRQCAIGGYLSVADSADYSEWKAAFAIELFQRPQFAFWKRHSFGNRP